MLLTDAAPTHALPPLCSTAKALMSSLNISALLVNTGTPEPAFITKRDFLKTSFSKNLRRMWVRCLYLSDWLAGMGAACRGARGRTSSPFSRTPWRTVTLTPPQRTLAHICFGMQTPAPQPAFTECMAHLPGTLDAPQ